MTKLDRIAIRSIYSLFCLAILLGGVVQVHAQKGDGRIEAIRRLDRQVNQQIAESENVPEGTGLYCNELVINKGDKSWPAVGIYQTVFKFYYTFGDREKDPYPNLLLKITVTTRRSDRHEYSEYLFNPAGQLVFYYEKNDEGAQAEVRYYFASEKLIKMTLGQRAVSARSREARDGTAAALTQKRELADVFRKSLRN